MLRELTGDSSDGENRAKVAFWILGMCNNFAYVIMLCAAEDILAGVTPSSKTDEPCQRYVTVRHCPRMSTGSVLLANIIPSLIVKVLYPFVMQRVPFGVRHFATVVLQIASFLIVAFSNSITVSLAGVALASVGSGLGEVTFLSLTTFFPSGVVGAWSSGTGGAGILGSFAYAALTDRHMLGLTPHSALLLMLTVPAVFAFTYWYVLILPVTIHRTKILRLSTYVIPYGPENRRSGEINGEEETARLIESEDEAAARVRFVKKRTIKEKMRLAKPLFRYMVPLGTVYLAEYFINQGLVELLLFDCAHGFNLSKSGQYRWYQVLYQLGVFISRSSVGMVQLSAAFIFLLPVLQLLNAIFFFVDALQQFVSHIVIIFAVVFYEGLLGGAAYVNVYRLLHKSIALDKKEFSLGFVSMSDSIGIVAAGFLAIPAHNFICDRI